MNHTTLNDHKIRLDVKREDLIHPHISGNKWRKLKYNIQFALDNNIDKVITFGGAFSNHIYATAAACKEAQLESIGIIRGEYDPLNPTLQFAQSCGMRLKFIDRTSYQEKERSAAVQNILDNEVSYFLIPEGGSNQHANPGLRELSEALNDTDYDIILVSAGTGGTASGILKWLHPSKELWVFSSLKSDHLHSEILDRSGPGKDKQLKLFSSYHLGGYGKSPEKLISFINEFKRETDIPLDPIYNGKLVFGFLDMVVSNNIDREKSYLWIHTGGLQGIDAYNYMATKKNRMKIT